eukprot:2873954-Prymnesium_polylepis.1
MPPDERVGLPVGIQVCGSGAAADADEPPCIEGRHPRSLAVDTERDMKGRTAQRRHPLVEALRKAIWEMQRDFACMGMPDLPVQGESIDVRPIKGDGEQCSEPKSDGEEPERLELGWVV